jgi:phage-related baseplate assembly protein
MSAPQPSRQATDPYQAKLERMRANAADDSTRPFMDDTHIQHENLTPEQARAYALWGSPDATGPSGPTEIKILASDVQIKPVGTSDAVYKERLERLKANASDDSTRPFMDDTHIQHENLTPEQARAYALWGSPDATGPKEITILASNIQVAPARQSTLPHQEKLEHVRANIADDSTRPFMDDTHVVHDNLTPEQARAYAVWGSPDATGPTEIKIIASNVQVAPAGPSQQAPQNPGQA